MPVTSMCRLCLAYCGVRVEVVDGRATKVTGDPDNPLSKGFTCAKARALPQQLSSPHRLLRSVARGPDGRHETVAIDDAIDGIARRLGEIVDAHGPRSVATYLGTGSAAYPASMAIGFAFTQALGSPMVFHPGTIDQPGKQVAMSLHGRWGGGAYDLDTADVWMFVGTNPIVSMWGGLTVTDPLRTLQRARRRGMRLVVVDPRRTELAAMSDVHVRPRPGSDAALAAGILRLVLGSGRYDRAFCDANVDGVEELEAAVAPFTPADVERRTGVAEPDLHAVTEVLLSSRRGGITAGTGANMTPWGTLTESLLLSLHTVCGYWRRAGETVRNPGVLFPPHRYVAAPEPAPPAFGPEAMRARPLRQTSAGMPTAALPDEMLADGPDRVRAFLNLGGNPVAAWPDQLKTVEAMRALDLHVCFDVRMSATARYADYVIASKFALEVPQITGSELSIAMYGATSSLFPIPYAMYSPAVVDPPLGSEVVEEWEVLLGVARRLGLTIELAGTRLEPGASPTTDDLYEILFGRMRVPLAEVRRYEHGHVFDDHDPVLVEERDPGDTRRLRVADPIVLDALAALAATTVAPSAEYPFSLISRRMKNAKNSSGLDVDELRGRHRINPAFLNPVDLVTLGLTDGDTVEIRSARGAIPALVIGDDTVPTGVVSMSHAWGDAPERDAEFREIGSCTSRLVDSTRDFDAITGMPFMTAVPVSLGPRRSIG
jgi:anaerobic selenocysteine-containing dehydrogenase